MKNAFEKISAGLDDAIAFVGGDAGRGTVASLDVKAIREATAMTQASFAEAFRLKLGTLRDWEQGRRQPDAGSVVLLSMIRADASAVREIIARV